MAKQSTFFPDNWSQEKIQNEIAYVREKITDGDIDPNGGGWYATWNSDRTFKIGMYINGNLSDMSVNIGLAFPIL